MNWLKKYLFFSTFTNVIQVRLISHLKTDFTEIISNQIAWSLNIFKKNNLKLEGKKINTTDTTLLWQSFLYAIYMVF